MKAKIVDTILPTTMVGSYPRPHWYKHQLLGRDIRIAFKEVQHEEAYGDATQVVIRDQEEAGLDIVTDGQMSYDDYVGVIGSFCWYMYERIPGFDQAKEQHPSEIGAPVRTKEIELLADWGGVVNSGPGLAGSDPARGSLQDRLAVHEEADQGFSGGRPGQPGVARSLQALQRRPRAQRRAGADLQRRDEGTRRSGRQTPADEDLGAWLPLFTNDESDYKWIGEVIARCVDGVDAKIGWHFCFGNAWGNTLSGMIPAGYKTVLPHFHDVPIDQFVLDFANREMVDVDCLKSLPKEKDVQIGILDVRTTQIESPEQIADRIRKVLKVLAPERVTLSTDCGMKPLPRMVAKMKLRALAEAAKIVRKELKS